MSAARPPARLRASYSQPSPSWTARTEAFVVHVGKIGQLQWEIVRALFQRPFEFHELVRQIEALGVASMGIVIVTSLFIGMVMAVQFAFGLQKFGGLEYSGRIMSLSFARELSPTFTAVIVGGRVGAGMAAELGAMAVTEQIDAVLALGANPVKKLVLPRYLAAVIVMPILSVISFVLGFAGAMFITDLQFGVPGSFYLKSALDSLTMFDFLSGVLKTPFFGAIIALLGCYFGMTTRGGTAGVGRATTRTVVATSINVLIADFVLTRLAITLWPQ